MTVLLLCSSGAVRLLSGQSSEAPGGDDKPVEEAFHNIQILKGMPQSGLLPVMQFMRASLGVRCDHCHIAENGMYWKDERPAKAKARQMLQMVNEINQHFGGEPVITCNTCHRGRVSPVGIPSVTQAAFENTLRTPAEEQPAELPPLETILQHYERSMGGHDALMNVRSRLMRAQVCRPRLLNPQQVPIPMEIYQKGPDKILVVVHAGEQTTRTAFDGSAASLLVDGKLVPAPASIQMRARSLLSTYVLGDLRDQYQALKVTGREVLDGGPPTFVVEGLDRYNKRQRLFFDAGSGFLVRRIAYTRTRVGDDPEQVDYSDFWDAGGVKLPRRVVTSTLDKNHLDLITLIVSVENNLAVDDAEFTAAPNRR